ncbi:MAG: hypothetical protein U5J96_17200 [Ignavibacteriaceae bacterium]|nr:hypothetical protein [Ignavibacteriaceae bacterium]
MGDMGMILRTSNAGSNWIFQVIGTDYWLNDVYFIDVNNGTAVSGLGISKILMVDDLDIAN